MESWLHAAGARVTVLCAPADMWFSDAAFAEMEREVPAVQVGHCVHATISAQLIDAWPAFAKSPSAAEPMHHV